MKCFIDEIEKDLPVVENLGYQGGRRAKVVLDNGKERVVIKAGKIWRTIKMEEKYRKGGVYTGQ